METLWRAVDRAAHLTLVLDYDGTLAPFRVERDQAVPLPGIRELLAKIRDQSPARLCVLSGRRAEEVAGLLGVSGVTVVGCHGFERRDPDGTLHTPPLDPAQQAGLRRARQRAEALDPGQRLEQKPSGLAFHTRGLAPRRAEAEEAQIARDWQALAEETGGLACRRFNGGVELRLAGVDKGVALATLLDEGPAESLCVYLGDDDTDEDAFAEAARRGGFGVRVGDEGRPSAARFTLADCEAVRDFLGRWLDRTRPDPG